MASFHKIQQVQMNNLLIHNNRTKDDGHEHSNESIDLERTPLNYHFKQSSLSEVKDKINEYYHQNRGNMINLAEMVVTLPQDVKKEDEEKFFKACYDFYCEDFGEENIVNAVVHKDEKTPHIHIDFIPVKVYSRQNEEGEEDRPYASANFHRENLSDEMNKRIENWCNKTGNEFKGIICCKELINRLYLKQMHPRLLDYMTDELGYECEILNGATENGNKTVLQLKNETLQKDLELKKNELNVIDKNVNIILKKTREYDIDEKYFSSLELFDLLDKYKNERDIYKYNLLKNGITNLEMPKKENDNALRSDTEDVGQSEILSNGFTYKSGLYVPVANTINILETYKNDVRILPQRAFIESQPQLERIIEKLRPRDIKMVNYDKQYLVFPTDNINDTFANLMRIKRLEKEFKGKTLSFPKISNDTYNLAESILRECNFRTDYYIHYKKTIEDIQKQNEEKDL